MAAAGVPVDQQGRVVPDPQVLGLPMSGEFMAADQSLQQEMHQALLNIGIQRDTIPKVVESLMARMKTDQGLEERGIREGMSDRGMLDSTITGETTMLQNLPRQRQWQDYMQDVNSQYGDLAQQELAARHGYQTRRDELINRYALGLDPTASNIWHGNRDYYETGKGPYWDGSQEGGYYGDYGNFVEQPGPPVPGPGGGPPRTNPGGSPSKKRWDRKGSKGRSGGTVTRRRGSKSSGAKANKAPATKSQRRRGKK